MTGDRRISDYDRTVTFWVAGWLFAATWVWWGVELVRGEGVGPGAVTAWVAMGAYLLAERWSREARRSRPRGRWVDAWLAVDSLRWAVWLAWCAYIVVSALAGGIGWRSMLWFAFASLSLGLIEPWFNRRAARERAEASPATAAV
jgi:hypothetical protein